jgi:hypothetical protein
MVMLGAWCCKLQPVLESTFLLRFLQRVDRRHKGVAPSPPRPKVNMHHLDDGHHHHPQHPHHDPPPAPPPLIISSLSQSS